MDLELLLGSPPIFNHRQRVLAGGQDERRGRRLLARLVIDENLGAGGRFSTRTVPLGRVRFTNNSLASETSTMRSSRR